MGWLLRLNLLVFEMHRQRPDSLGNERPGNAVGPEELGARELGPASPRGKGPAHPG